MAQKEVLRLVTVPVLRQHCRNLIFSILLCIEFWMGDVVVVGDTAILCRLMLISRSKEVHLVSVATIGTE